MSVREVAPLRHMDSAIVMEYARNRIMQMDRRLMDDDVSDDLFLQQAARLYVERYTGDFPYLHNLKNSLDHYDSLTIPQARGALNCFRSELQRQERNGRSYTPPKDLKQDEPQVLPNGYYTVVFGDKHYTIRLRKAKYVDNMPASTQIAAILTGPDNESSYTNCGFVVGRNYRGFRRYQEYFDWHRAIRILLDEKTNFDRAGQEYALKSGNCYICNHTLTTDESIARGIGPICLSKLESF